MRAREIARLHLRRGGPEGVLEADVVISVLREKET